MLAPPPKKFAWSYSKLKNFETCPKRHYHIDLAKDVKEAESEALTWGNYVHKELAKAAKTRGPLPEDIEEFQPWIKRVCDGSGELFVEQQYAITREFKPTTWFGHNAWYRCIGDIVRIDNEVGLVLDWKTGKIVQDSVQLALMAQGLFSHFPKLSHVRAMFIWLKDDWADPETYTRDDLNKLWPSLLDRVDKMVDAQAKQEYPAKPGRLCKSWCPVASCVHHGRGGQ